MNRMIKALMYKLFYTCEKATQLIEKKASAESLGFIENIRLAGHLAMCKFCNAYSKKVGMIDDAMVRMSENQTDDVDQTEALEFRDQLKERTLNK